MGKSSSSNKKKMTNVKFFIIVLIISLVITMAVAIGLDNGNEDTIQGGLLIAVVAAIYITLFRILKKNNDPENRLGNWKYFFAMCIFISGILIIGILFINEDEDAALFALMLGIFISAIISLWRAFKHWRKGKKATKERNRQYQDQLQRQNRQYAEELEKKNRKIRDLESQNSELQKSRRTVYSTSSSQSQRYQEEQMGRQRDEQMEREREKRNKERLEDWYREYVTIEVNFEYLCRNNEYGGDYWDPRSEDIRVTRREAMALIEAGEGAILARIGYSNWSLIRNFSYKMPYRLYDHP